MNECRKCGAPIPRKPFSAVEDTVCRGCVRDALEPLFARAARAARLHDLVAQERRMAWAELSARVLRAGALLLLLLLIPAPASAREQRPLPACWIGASISMMQGGPVTVQGGWSIPATRAYAYLVPFSAAEILPGDTQVRLRYTTFQKLFPPPPVPGVTEVLLLVYNGPAPSAPVCSVHAWVIL